MYYLGESLLVVKRKKEEEEEKARREEKKEYSQGRLLFKYDNHQVHHYHCTTEATSNNIYIQIHHIDQLSFLCVTEKKTRRTALPYYRRGNSIYIYCIYIYIHIQYILYTVVRIEIYLRYYTQSEHETVQGIAYNNALRYLQCLRYLTIPLQQLQQPQRQKMTRC